MKKLIFVTLALIAMSCSKAVVYQDLTVVNKVICKDELEKGKQYNLIVEDTQKNMQLVTVDKKNYKRNKLNKSLKVK